MKISYYLLSNKKKLLLIQMLVLTTAFVSILIFHSLTRTAIQTIDTNRYNEYGNYFAVAEEGTTVDSVDITRSNFQIFGYINLPDQSRHFSLGSMSEEFAVKNSIHLIKGRLPQNASEVVVEEHIIRNESLNLAYGSDFLAHLNETDSSHEFKIVGVITDYSHSRSLHEDVMTASFPSFFTVQDAFSPRMNYQLLTKDNAIGLSFNQIDQMGIKGNYSINIELYNGLSHYSSFNTINRAMILLISSFTIFSLILVYFYQKDSLAKEIFLLSNFGMNRLAILTNELAGYTITGFLSIFFSFILYRLVLIFSSVWTTQLRSLEINELLFVLTLFSFSLLIIITILGFDLYKKIEKKNNLIKDSVSNSQGNTLSSNDSFLLKHIYLTIDQFPKLALATTFIFTLVLCGVTLYRVLEEEQVNFQFNTTRTIDNYIENYSLKSIRGYTVFDPSVKWLSWSDVNKIKGVSNGNAVSTQIADEDLYVHLDNEAMTRTILNTLSPDSFNNVGGGGADIKLSRFVHWMDSEHYYHLIDHLGTDKLNTGATEAILVHPQVENQLTDIQLDNVHISRLNNTGGNYSEDLWTVPIHDVVHPSSLENFDLLPISQESLLIIPLTAVAQETFADRISGLSIQLDPALSNEKYNQLRNTIVESSAGIPNIIVRDSLGSQKEVILFTQSYQTIGYLTIILILILTSGIVFAIQYSKFLKEKEKYGIYLIHGMTRKKLKRYVISELLIYSIVSLLFSFLFTIFIFLANPTSEYFLDYIYQWLFSIIYLFCPLFIAFLILNRKIDQYSIKAFLLY